MQNLVFTQLSVDEVRRMLREEIRNVINEVKPSKPNKPTPADETEGYMNIKKLSAYTDLAIASIYGLVHRKQIPYIKRRKRLLFDKQEIDKWLEEGSKRTSVQIDRQAEEYVRNNPL